MPIRRVLTWSRLLVVLALVVASVSAQEAASRLAGPDGSWPRASLGDLRFFVDEAQFRGVQGFALQEFYTILDARQLQFVPEAGSFVAQIDLAITIMDDAGQKAGEETWTRNFSVTDLRELKDAGGLIRDQIGFSLKPGRYSIEMTVEDIYGDTQGSVEAVFSIEDLETAGLVSSGVLFASRIAPAAGEGRFVRNGWEIVPRTTRIFGLGEPVSFYHEVYNLSPGANPGAFDVRYTLLSEDGVPVGVPVDHRFKKGGESAVLIDSLSTDGLSAGRYLLQVQARDLDNRARTERRALVLLQPEQGAEEALTEDQKKSLSYYRHIRWVAEEKDYKMYQSLEGLEAKDKFLKSFWKRLDPTPETVVNERLIEHIRRMRYADNNFSGSHKQEGYDTDKGRVYVKYGPPTDREYRSAVENVKPSEIWTYQTQGTYEFIFRDRRGLGIYELVHSNYPGEFYNPDWQNEI